MFFARRIYKLDFAHLPLCRLSVGGGLMADYAIANQKVFKTRLNSLLLLPIWLLAVSHPNKISVYSSSTH